MSISKYNHSENKVLLSDKKIFSNFKSSLPSFIPLLPGIIPTTKLLINKPISGIPKKLDSIADHIKKARLENKLFQRQLAQKLRVNTSTIILWENGKTTNISATNYFKIVQFLGYCPIEQVPQTTGKQIFFYRKHRGISRKDLAKSIGTVDTEIKLWEKENFLVNCLDFGFTQKKKQALESLLQIDNLPKPDKTFTTGNLPSNIRTMGQHLRHRRETLGLSKREVEQILKLKRRNYTRWEEDGMKRLSPRLLVRVVEFLVYCPLETFSTEGEKLRIYRTYAGLEQSELAKQVGCVAKTIYHWECGRWEMSEETKQKFRSILNINF